MVPNNCNIVEQSENHITQEKTVAESKWLLEHEFQYLRKKKDSER